MATDDRERLAASVPAGTVERVVALAGSSRKQGDYLAGLVDRVWADRPLALAAVSCPLCQGSGRFLAHVGGLAWFACDGCAAEFAVMAAAVVASDAGDGAA